MDNMENFEEYLNTHFKELMNIFCDATDSGAFSVLMDDEFTMLYGDDKYYEIYEYTREGMADKLNNKCINYIYPEDIPAVRKYCNYASNSEKKRVQWEMRVITGKGNMKHVKVVGSVISWNDKKVMHGIAMDISKEKENDIKFESLLNTLPGGVAIYKIGSQIETVYSSEGVPKLSGRTMEEYSKWVQEDLFGNTVFEDDLPKMMKVIEQSVANGQDVNITYRLKHKNGSLVWVQLLAKMIGVEDGCAVYYAVYTKPTEESSLYQQVVDNSVTAALILEKKNRKILFANKTWRKMEGVNEEEVIVGRPITDVVKKDIDLIPEEEVLNLPTDHFREVFITREDNIFYHAYMQSVNWNGVDAYIIYFVNETVEHTGRQELQEIVERVPGGIGIYELTENKAVRVFLNDGYYKLVGGSRDQYNGANDNNDIFTEVHPDDLDGCKNVVSELINGKNHIDFSYRVKNINGEYVWIKISANVVVTSDNKRILYCSFVSVDAEKKAEILYQKLIEDNNRLENDNLIVKARYNLTQNTLEYSTSKIKEKMITKPFLPYDEMHRQVATKISSADTAQKFLDIFSMDNLISEFKKGKNEFTLEVPFSIGKTGQRWMKINCKLFEEPTSGDTIAYLFNYDITQENIERNVSRTLFSSQYEAISTINLISGDAQITEYRNNRHIETTYKEGFRLIENLMRRTVCDDDIEDVLAILDLNYIKNALSSKDSVSLAYSIKGSDNTVHRMRIWYSYLDESKEILLVTNSDITDVYLKEQKQIETLKAAVQKAKSADESKTEFFSRMSHDMRTPMNGILGMAELSENENCLEVLQRNMTKIKESGDYLLGLINDTLDFQKIESGNLVLEPVVVDTMSIMSGIIDIIRPAAKRKNIDFRVINKNADLNWYVKIDPLRIKQIFVNLLSNAVKFTPKGGTIEFEYELVKREGMISHDKVCIRDTGIGMSEEFINTKLFQPFSQERNEVTEQYAGSGLGLSIVKKLVELMGGKIEVQSELGVGTTFTIYLDFERINEEEVQKEVTSREQDQKETFEELRGRKILLAEDHPLNAEIAIKLLEKIGCSVTWTHDGKECADTFLSSHINEFDVILMDIRMPIMSGLEAADCIRKSDRADAKKIPIIAMTANAYADDIKKSLKAGMNAHLSKPIDIKKMYQTIAQVLALEE